MYVICCIVRLCPTLFEHQSELHSKPYRSRFSLCSLSVLEPLYLGVFQPVLRILDQGPSRPHYSVLVRGASKAAGVFYTLWTRGVCECGSALRRLCVCRSLFLCGQGVCVNVGQPYEDCVCKSLCLSTECTGLSTECTGYKLWTRNVFSVFRDQ